MTDLDWGLGLLEQSRQKESSYLDEMEMKRCHSLGNSMLLDYVIISLRFDANAFAQACTSAGGPQTAIALCIIDDT